ncbi:hypothetical protein LguiB_025602 [Lonicera macranthoides]
MGREGDVSDSKSQLVTEICNLLTRAIICAQRHPLGNANKSPFIDWYLVLQVEENVGIDTIRKKYHKLALQLHPDKNNHPKAETAFKLLLEAYACLSDNARRAIFDAERGNIYCIDCHRNSYGKSKGVFSAEKLRSNKLLQRMKEIRVRFMEEARVIEECLKANSSPRKEYPCFGTSSKEIPVFNPPDFPSQGYPRQWTRNCETPDGFLWLRRENVFELGRGSCDSPIFECRSDQKRKFRFRF